MRSVCPQAIGIIEFKWNILTLDVMHCQRDTAKAITDGGGDYALALKGNQGTLHDDVTVFFADPDRTPADIHTTTDGDHGRIEVRHYK